VTQFGDSTQSNGSPRRPASPYIVGAVGGAAVAAALALAIAVAGPGHGQQPAVPLQGQAPSAPAARSQSGGSSGPAAPAGSIAAIYQKARPAVVEIDVSGGQGQGLGTGVIISDQGEILTNAHVVSGARRVQVKLSDGTTLPATVKGVNDADDLAVVQANIPSDKMAVISLGDSSALQPGTQVVAIGNPFGLEGSVTQGIVSGIRDNPDSQGPSKVIQIDAAINPGNSGGPLLDMNGKLVGINEALENPTGQDVFVGIGFAVPVNTAKSDLNQLRSGGSQANGSSNGSNSGSGNGSGSGSRGGQRGGSGQGGSGNPFQGGSGQGGSGQGGSGSPFQGRSGNPYQGGSGQGGSGGPFDGGSGNPFQDWPGNPFQGLPGNPFQGGSFGG
jgi:putative serine protease PepD